MKYSDLPQDIKDVQTALAAIDAQYETYVGYMHGGHYNDISRGDKIRMGRLNAKLWRLIELLTARIGVLTWLLALLLMHI